MNAGSRWKAGCLFVGLCYLLGVVSTLLVQTILSHVELR